jgi:hypothetical protein
MPSGENSTDTNGKEISVKNEDLKINNLKTIVSRNLSETSFHAVNAIYETNDLFLKIILVICLLTSSGFCFVLTVQTFTAYFSYSVITSNTDITNIPTECNAYYKIYSVFLNIELIQNFKTF